MEPNCPKQLSIQTGRRLGAGGFKSGKHAGMSLVEVVIALGILGIVASGIVGVTFHIRSMSEQTVYQNTSLTLAQGYIEQLRSLDYNTLDAAARDASNSVALPLTNAGGAQATDTSSGTLNNGEWSQETVFLDETAAGTPIQPLTFRFRPVLTSLTVATAGTTRATGVEITVFFQTTYNFGVTRSFSGALRTVRSSVPTY